MSFMWIMLFSACAWLTTFAEMQTFTRQSDLHCVIAANGAGVGYLLLAGLLLNTVGMRR